LRSPPRQRELHQRLFDPPDDPTGYSIRHDHPLTDAEKAEEASARGWLHAAGVSKADGDQLAATALKLGPTLIAMDDAQRNAYRAQTQQRMQRAWGAQADQRLAEASRLVLDLEKTHPGITQWLEQTGLGDSWEVVSLAAKAARKRHGRGKT
jgi:hypothetical protein